MGASILADDRTAVDVGSPLISTSDEEAESDFTCFVFRVAQTCDPTPPGPSLPSPVYCVSACTDKPDGMSVLVVTD